MKSSPTLERICEYLIEKENIGLLEDVDFSHSQARGFGARVYVFTIRNLSDTIWERILKPGLEQYGKVSADFLTRVEQDETLVHIEVIEK